MKQITSSLPLCFMLPNSNIVTALPYIDEEIPEYKTKIQYLIKSQQNKMEFNQQQYLKDFHKAETPYLNSIQFQEEVARIQSKNQQMKANKKDKKSVNIFDGIGQSLISKSSKFTPEQIQKIERAIITYENNLIKQINLEIMQKLTPLTQLELIDCFDKQKQKLSKLIQEQKRAIEQINKRRQYYQYEARQRQKTVKDRANVMIHKQKRIQ